MLSNEVIEQLSDIIADRMNDINSFTLQEIAKSLKKIKDLTPSQAQKLAQIFKYGGDYDKIKKELKRLTKINLKDIDKIFEEVAKKNQKFAKQFYDYRNVKFVPYEENKALQRQVDAIAKLTKQEYLGFARTIGFTTIKNGKRVFTPLAKMYNEVLEKAILSVAQGKSTTNDEIHKIVDELSASGLKTIDYGTTYIGKDGKEHYYTRRLDSAVRMNVMDGIRSLTNEVNRKFGEEFGADGVEITVHDAPAPDHANVQGRQFANAEFDKFQNDKDCYDIKGNYFPAEFDGHDRRSISQYNCYHGIFPIVIGVSEPQYTDEQLEKIKQDNLDGFTTTKKLKNGKVIKKHRTLYEGKQMQRNLETEIRKAKDNQIMNVELGDEDEIIKSQARITLLNKKYKELNDISGLSPRKERMRVKGYKRRAVK